MQLRAFIISLGLYCGAVVALYGQERKVDGTLLREGLSQGYIADILQDREGFIWAGTKNGLNRYDGQQFKVFVNDPAQPYSLSDDYVMCLSEWGDFLLVGTNGGGLNLFHKKTQRFYRIPDQLPNGERLESPIIYRADVDAQGNIWLLYWKENKYVEGHLRRIRVPAGFWERLPGAKDPWAGISIDRYERPFWMYFMNRDRQRLHLIDAEKISEIDIKSAAIRDMTVPIVGPFQAIREDSLGHIWTGNDNKVCRFDGKVWSVWPTDFEIETLLGFDLDQHLLLCDKQGHLLSFAPKQVSVGTLRGQDSKFHFQLMDPGKCIVDQSNILWLATSGYGIQKIALRSGRFQTYFKNASIYTPPFSGKDGAIAYFDFQYGPIFYPNTSTHPLNAAPYAHLRAPSRYLQDCQGNHWVLFWQNAAYQLLKIGVDGQKKVIFLRKSGERNGNMALDKQCHLWIAQDGCLFRVDTETGDLALFDYSAVLPLGHEARALVETNNGHWWIATEYGLVEATPADHGFVFKIYKNEPQKPGGLRNENLSALLPDSKDAHLLWIGTKGGGLAKLDTRNGMFSHLTTKQGLPDNVIYGILDDAVGNLWLSSNQGLIRYNPATGAAKNFTEADGLQSNEFNTWAYGKTQSGALMFGGVKGLNVFDPKDWEDNPVIPPVLLTGIKINNQAISPGDSSGILHFAPEFTSSITLPYSQNSFTIDFAALEFSAPSKNRFRYYLKGAEADWAHEGTEHSAQYLNLQAGRYTFIVTGSNNDGVWNPTPATLQIVVLPPWYRSWWAYLGYLALLCSGIYFFYRDQLKRQLAKKEAAQLKALDAFKSRFFTNISHEFRTPLTVILGTATQLMTSGEQSKAKLGLIRRNGESLLRLVNQILDLAKLEDRSLHLHYQQGNVLAYLRYVAESLHSLANVNNVLLQVESRSAAIVMDYDPDRLLQIAHNLLSNAIKFTPSGGRVLLQANVVALDHKPDKWLEVKVVDTGVGIPEDDLPKVFERFYQAQNQEHAQSGGTGIGLSLTKELVQLMGGSISVESPDPDGGQGTVFTIHLPITNQAKTVEAVGELPPKPDMQPVLEGTADTTAPIYHILLIEDNPDVVEYLRNCLGAQYRLDYAYNGRAGIEKALDTIPDLIISDVMMPEKDGFEVCNTLKNDERSSHIPLVLLTAKAGMEDRLAGLKRGADAYLAKPFHPEELLLTLQNLLELRRKLQERYATALHGAIPNTAPDPSAPNKPDLEDAFLQKVRAAVESRLSDTAFSGEDLCRIVGMSYPVVYRKLSALTGRSLNLYIRQVRLEKARELLAHTSLGIAEVAYDTGFNDPKFFSRVFSEAYGVSPSMFRQQRVNDE